MLLSGGSPLIPGLEETCARAIKTVLLDLPMSASTVELLRYYITATVFEGQFLIGSKIARHAQDDKRYVSPTYL